MDWSQSYSSSLRVFRVNRKTWADGPVISNVDKVGVSRTANGSLLESGSIDVVGDFEANYYRITLTVQQGGEVERVDVATLLFEGEKGEHNYGVDTRSISGYSVLYPASTTAVTNGEYAPAGVNGAEYAKELLQSAINAPVEVEGSFTLNEHVVHDLGSSVLDAVWAVLEAGGFIMQIDGRGVVHMRPKPTDPSLILDSASPLLITEGIEFGQNIDSLPNRYLVIVDNTLTVATNDDTESVISTVNRGYCVDIVDTSPTLVNGETLAEYANRKLKELSVVKDTRSYAREFAPGVYVYSVVRASIGDFDGEYRVESQTVNVDKGITISETASKEISLWQ